VTAGIIGVKWDKREFPAGKGLFIGYLSPAQLAAAVSRCCP
jgi:hypothetical protein